MRRWAHRQSSSRTSRRRNAAATCWGRRWCRRRSTSGKFARRQQCHNLETFIMARTDALAPLGLDEALRRAELYLKAGADGIYIEAVETVEQLQKVGQRLRGAALATSILEGGGRTPWVDPKDFHALGYTMLLYPTTVIFR